MSHNAYVRGSLANWATGSQVSAQNFWDLDQYCYSAINGDAGGTWSPSSVITIGGVNGLTLAAGTPLVVGGTLNVTSTTTLGTVNVGGVFSTFANAVLGLNSGNTLTVRATSTFDSPATFDDTVTAGGSFVMTGSGALTVPSTITATLAGDNSVGSTPGSTGKATTLTGDLVSAGNGGRVALSFIDMSDADASLGYYHRYLYTSLTANRNLYLTIADPRTGTELFIHNKDDASLVAVYIGGVFVVNVFAGTTVMIIKGDSSWFSVTM
jgi:hypothetical protein